MAPEVHSALLSGEILPEYNQGHSSGAWASPLNGARPYLATIGRFLAIDPVEGGTSNDYTYGDDPINQLDAGGRF